MLSVVQLLPVLMIIESIAAAVGYALDGDIRHALYWTFAAGITASVTF